MPGIAEKLAFKDLNRQEEIFVLFNNKHKDLVKLFLDNNVGGPAIIFDRYAEKGIFIILWFQDDLVLTDHNLFNFKTTI